MDNIVLERVWKRSGTLYVECIDGNLYTGEEQAHTFRITGQDEHGTVTPITGTISGKFLRADNLDVPLVGSLDGGVAVLTLTEQCYDCRGRYVLSIFADDGEHKICIYCGTGNVFRTDGEGTIDPGNIIQDVSDLIDRIQTAIGQIPTNYSALTARVTQTETDVSDLKSAIDDMDKDVHGVISYNYTEGKKITADNSGYSIDDDANTCVSELIEITWDWDTSTYVRYYYNGVQGETLDYRIIYFDENENYIGYRGTEGVAYRAVTNCAGGKYVRFSFKKGTIGKLMQNVAPQAVYWEARGSVSSPGLVQNLGDLDDLETTTKSSVVEAINEVNEKEGSFSGEIGAIADELDGLKSTTAEEKTISETNDIDITMHDGYLAQTGIKYETGNYLNHGYTDKIAVQPGDVIRGYNNTTAMNDVTVLCEYNGETFVNGYNPKSFPYTVPEGVTHIAVSTTPTYKSALRLTLTRTSTVLVPILEDRVDALETAVIEKVDKGGTNQVTLKNCDFAYLSPNLFNTENLVSGLLNKSTGAIIERYTDYRTSEFIPVSELTDYVISSGQQFHVYYCWYGATQNYLSGAEAGVNTTLSLTSPANAAYFRMSMTLTQTGYNVQFEEGTTPTEYMPFGDGYILPQYIRTVHEEFPLNLPSKVYALAGTEINLYFDNMVDGRYTDYDFNITCSVGMQLERGFRVTAASAEAGTYSLIISATRKTDGSVVEKTATLIITDTSAGSGDSASVIILGDSTTDNPYVTGKIHTDFSEDVMTISTVGTRGTAPNNHEGRSGWRFEYYFTKESMTYTDGRGTIYNPFYNPTSQTFDAAYYFANSGISKPDYFVINLGINDMFGALSDAQLAASIESGIGYCDSMIASIKSASPNTKVVVCMTIPPNFSQDAFGKEYKNRQTRARYKRNNILWVERLIDEYDGREAESIYLCPINLSLDTIYNMGMETMPVNARNTAMTYESPIANGGVHPVESGYWQIADVYTAFLKAHANS